MGVAGAFGPTDTVGDGFDCIFGAFDAGAFDGGDFFFVAAGFASSVAFDDVDGFFPADGGFLVDGRDAMGAPQQGARGAE